MDHEPTPVLCCGRPTDLWIWQFCVLQRCHVTPDSELFAVITLQVLFPLIDLVEQRFSTFDVRHDGQLKVGHVSHFAVLFAEQGRERREREKKTPIKGAFPTYLIIF